MRKVEQKEQKPYVTRLIKQKRPSGSLTGESVEIKIDEEDAKRFDKYNWNIRYSPTANRYEVYMSYLQEGHKSRTYWFLQRWLKKIQVRQKGAPIIYFANGDCYDFRKNNLVKKPTKKSIEGNYSLFDDKDERVSSIQAYRFHLLHNAIRNMEERESKHYQ